jgi:CubicO group peptidase (beta-lactamase class C family)
MPTPLPRRPAFRGPAVLLVVLPASFAAAAAPLEAQFTPFQEALARFDARVAAAVADDGAGAVSVAVFRGSEVLWEKGWGWADIENGVPAEARTIGRTGSISKTFTAVLMMQLAERGLIDLDEPVANHFPEIAGLVDVPPEGPPITFRMLASHTAGLVREPDLQDAASGAIHRWEEKVLESIAHTGFQTPPGTEYAYSNIGYGMLGLALSRAAGQPFMELMETLIFRPLAMESTTFVVDTPDLIGRMSVGYSRNSRTGEVSAEQATREHFGRGYKVPNGGVYSTVGDMAAFAAALMGAGPVRILSDESRRAMLTAQAPAEGYGLGLQLYDVDGHPVAGHGGSVAGYNASLVFDPETGMGAAMLRTTGYNPPVAGLLAELVRAGELVRAER